MDENLYKWALWCDTCECERRTEFIPESDGGPTVCPYNNAHTNVRDQTIVDTVSLCIGQVKIIDTDKLDPVTANTIYKGEKIEVGAGESVGDWFRDLHSPIEAVCGEAYVDDGDWSYGDRVDFWLQPPNNGVIGVTTAVAAQGQPVVSVSADVLQNIKVGFYLTFGESARDTAVYRIKGIDTQNGLVTLEENLEAEVPSGSTVHLRVYYLREWLVVAKVVQKFAADTPGSAHIDAGWRMWMVLRLALTTPNGFTWYFGIVEKY